MSLHSQCTHPGEPHHSCKEINTSVISLVPHLLITIAIYMPSNFDLPSLMYIYIYIEACRMNRLIIILGDKINALFNDSEAGY